jgi:hypothetical protein
MKTWIILVHNVRNSACECVLKFKQRVAYGGGCSALLTTLLGIENPR